MRLDEEQMENAIGIGFNQMSGTPADGGGRGDAHALHAGGILGTGRGAGGRARAARHHRLEGRRRRPLRHLQDLHPRQRAGLERDRGRPRRPLSARSRSTASRCGRPAAIREPPTRRRCTCARSTDLRPEDVESITIVGGTGGTQQLCEPLERKRRPQTSIDGKFSIPFTTAVMMAKGNVTLRDYTAAGLADPAVLAMADRISYRAGTEAITGKGGSSDVSRTAVEIVTKDGRRFEHRSTGVPGDPQNPVTLGSARSEVPGLRFVLGAAGLRGERRSRNRVDQESRERRGRDRDRPGCCRNRDRRATTWPRKFPSSAPATAARCTAPPTVFPSSATPSSCGPTLAGVDLRFANCERQYSARGTAQRARPARPPAARDGEDLHRLRLRRRDDRQQSHVRLRPGSAARYPRAAAGEGHRGDRRRQRTSPRRGSPRSWRRTASRSVSSATAR